MQTYARPKRARASQFKTPAEVWVRFETHPSEFLDVTAVASIANEVAERERKREGNGSETASKTGSKREKMGRSRDANVGPGHPPVEHQFKNGHPGGPGRPKGKNSMRKLIRQVLFDEETGGEFSAAVVKALFAQAIKGNTHAIRIICENGNNRPKR